MAKPTYFLYVDASGDDGVFIPEKSTSSTSYYALSGIIINIENWQRTLENILHLRKKLRDEFGILIRKELKGSDFFYLKGSTTFENTTASTRKKRIAVYHRILSELPTVLETSNVINLFLDKTKTKIESAKYFEVSWRNLLERYHRFLQRKKALGIVIPDEGYELPLKRHMRRLRRYNPVTSHYGGTYDYPLKTLIEDPFHRESSDSYFIQLCDLVVHALYRKELPKNSFKRYEGHRLFEYLKSILLTEVSKKDNYGIIRP